MFKTADDIRQLNDKISQAGQFTDKLKEEVAHVIIGQSHMLDRLLIGCWPTATYCSKVFPVWRKH
ncbi:MAG: hypothetical protein WDN26_21710 [Chitinophagaceae bacterium]